MSNTADWFARKMANNSPQPPAPQPQYQAPLSPLPPVSQQFQQPYVPAPQPRSKAQSASQTASCPGCGSENYMTPQGHPDVTPRCLDCGYPVEQAGSRYGALTGAKVEGNTRAAIGNNATNNYNPQTVIGRVG